MTTKRLPYPVPVPTKYPYTPRQRGSHPVKNPFKILFHHQRGNSRARGIEFCFTFEQWVAWWEKRLGPNWHKKRGRKKGQYVMARKGDKGPYRAGNVECILFNKNNLPWPAAKKRKKELQTRL